MADCLLPSARGSFRPLDRQPPCSICCCWTLENDRTGDLLYGSGRSTLQLLEVAAADSPPIEVRDIETKLDADWLPCRIATPRRCLDSMLIDSRWCRAKVDALVEVFRTVATT